MNEFLSYVKKGLAIDDYYEEFVKLSRHAPLMNEEQKLSKFILVLEGTLAKEVNALTLATLADALNRAKPKSLSFLTRKRTNPFPTSRSFQPQKTHRFNKQNSKQGFTIPMVAKPNVQQVKANALPINQSGQQIQCFEC